MNQFISGLKKIKRMVRNIRENINHQLTPDEIALIKDTHLFDNLGETAFKKLLKSLKFLKYDANDLIFKEGSKGNALYIIASGSVLVFTKNLSNAKVNLARLDRGNYFGEQALIGQANKSRNASIEAITDTVLIKIKAKFFKNLVAADNELRSRLIKVGHQQLVQKIVESVPGYENMKSLFMHREKQIISLNKDDVIFDTGDTPDFVYIILDGIVSISVPSPSGVKKINLTKGDLFGELGVLQSARRVGGAKAAVATKLIRIEGKEFRELYNNNRDLQQLINILGNSYALPNRGYATQFYGKIGSLSVVTTTYKLANNRFVLAAASTDNTFIMLEKLNQKSDIYKFQKENGTRIELTMTNGYLTCVKSWGNWRYLNTACACILDKKPISEEMLKAFQTKGIFRSKEVEHSEVVCACLSVTKDDIEDLIENGTNSLVVISEKTGACTVCGTCRPRILNMLGQNTWMTAALRKTLSHNEKIASFSIEPTDAMFNAALPGEHVIIQVKIGSHWVERAYSISGLKEANEYCITIKREDDGLLSTWLHDTLLKEVPIYVSQPQGAFKLIIEESTPIVCFAGEIGIAPFVAFARALKESKSQRAMHLIYIVSSQQDFIFLEDFSEIKKGLPNFKLTLWDKNKLGSLSDSNISEFIKDYGGANIYICGPDGFESALLKSLKTIDYRSDKIFVEKFTYTKPITLNNSETIL